MYNNNKVQYGNHGGRLRVNLDKTYLLNDITMEQFEGVKNSPSCYRTILQEKRNIIEKNAGKVDANIYKMLDQTDCMDDFYNMISPCLAKAKKLQKH